MGLSVIVAGSTITIGDNKYKCDAIAEEIAQSMPRDNHMYYPAIRKGGAVWVAPVNLSRPEALAIMMLNSHEIGVMAVSNKYAKGLCSALGGAEGPEGDSKSGYWYHYHGRSYRNAHCWFIGF